MKSLHLLLCLGYAGVVTTSLKLTILTFVLWPMALLAAPHSEAPESISDEPQAESGDPELLQNTTLTGIPKKEGRLETFIERFNRKDYYHAYRQNLYPHVGAVLALVDSTEDDPDKNSEILNYLLGFYWELPKKLSPKWEVGAAWTSMSLGHLNIMRKHIYNEKGAFRPFYRYGITLKIDPDEELATASNSENYLLRVGVGLEDIIKPPRSVRLDLDIAAGQEDFWVIFHYGYSFAM